MATNMKQRYIRLMSDYAVALGDEARLEPSERPSRLKSQDIYDEMIQIDFTDEYNDGTLPEQLWGETKDIYEQFIKDWKLDLPTGKPLDEPIVLTEMFRHKSV